MQYVDGQSIHVSTMVYTRKTEEERYLATPTKRDTMELVQHNGTWYAIHPKPHESTRQTYEVAWSQIREPMMTATQSYIQYYAKQRKEARILYPSFVKNDH